MTSEVKMREAFEKFMLHSRKSKGVKGREQLLIRREEAPTEYSSEHVQRHWWTWQNACGGHIGAIGEANALLADCHEIINQLIACHDEPDCPAIKVGREIMARIEAAASMTPDLAAGGREGVR